MLDKTRTLTVSSPYRPFQIFLFKIPPKGILLIHIFYMAFSGKQRLIIFISTMLFMHN